MARYKECFGCKKMVVMDDSVEGRKLFCKPCRVAYVAAGKPRNQRTRNQVRSTIDSKDWANVRKQVLARDGNICQNHRRNGVPMAIAHKNLQLDHICPQEARPDRIWDLTNLEFLCLSCHGRKTNLESFGVNGLPPHRITWDFRPNLWVAPMEFANPKRIAALLEATGIQEVFQYESAIHGDSNATNDALVIVPERHCLEVAQQIRARFHRFLLGFNN